MSESEIRKRHDYRRNRKRWIVIQAIVIALVIVCTLVSALIYNRLDKTYYIEYTERGLVDYEVQYTQNSYFDEEWMPSGQSYVSDLVNSIYAEFAYRMDMDTADVGFDYTYDVTLQLIVADKTTGDHIYAPQEVLIPKTTKSVSGTDNFKIEERVLFNFAGYNQIAKEFINTYALKNATANLVATLNVDVLSSSDSFEENNSNRYFHTLNIPLGEENFSITTSNSIATSENKVLACKGAANQDIFKSASIISALLAFALIIILIIFTHATRNEDVNYTIRIQKLLRAYRSFIQQINGRFDVSGYQTVPIKTFVEMLGIRDTIQSPILMSENKDQTRTQFLIPTNTKILYLFEIKVDNYDELYGAHPEWKDDSLVTVVTEEETAPEKDDIVKLDTPADDLTTKLFEEIESLEAEKNAPESAEEVALEQEPTPEPVAEPTPEPVAEPAGIDIAHVLNDLEYDEEHGYFVDEKGVPVNIQCRRSFTANIIQSDPETVKYYYSELKNYVLSFKGVKARMSWRYEAFKRGRDQLVRIKIRGKSICLYLALDPEQFDKTKYFQEAIDAKMFDCVPMLVKVKSQRGLKRAFELIDAVMEKFAVPKNPKAKPVDYVAEHPYESTKALVERELIKILDNSYIISEPKKHVEEPLAEEVFEEPTEVSAESEIIEEVEAIMAAAAEDAEIQDKSKLDIHCKRSFMANLIQSDIVTVKTYYSELKNYILSFRGVKSRSAWRYESYNRGRDQLFRIRIKGKGIHLYCALDPNEVDEARYFHEASTAKDYQDVPTGVKIKTERGLKRAKELVDRVMQRFAIEPNPKAKTVDYLELYPFRTTAELVADGYVKVLSDTYKIKEPKAPKVPKRQKSKKA